MSYEARPQYAKVRAPHGCDPAVLHCPICGQATRDIDNEGEISPCAHLAFIYSEDWGDFEYYSEAFSPKREYFDLEDLDLDTFADCLMAAGYHDEMLAIEITFSGVGCGPTSYTEVCGFDFGTLPYSDDL